MLSLKDREWKPFQLGTLFEIHTGGDLILSRVEKGNIPIISHSKMNNGVAVYTNLIKGRKLFDASMSISLADRGNFCAYVQRVDFYVGTRVKALVAKFRANREILTFVCTLINNQSTRFSYGNNATDYTDKITILIPITESDAPDWQFMEQYIRELEQLQLEAYIGYAEKVLSETDGVEGVLPLREKEWKAFHIEKIATIEPGRDIYDAERRSGDTPYISSTSINNGIAHYVSNHNSTKEANCISVNRNGSVGYAFYHPYEALYSNDCRKLQLNQPSKYVSIFIAHQITMQRKKYSYGYKMGTARLKRQLILLPIGENNEPDWAYMEQYAKAITNQILMAYLKQKGCFKSLPA